MSIKPVTTSEYFQTSDISLATTLSLWYPLDSVDRTDRRAQFHFKRNEHLDDVVERYWRDQLKVEPKSYFNALKVIKSRLYDGER